MSLATEKMDPLNSFLGKMLMEEISPVIMVLATHLAEDACQRNGLSFTETLLPFSLFNKIDVPVRTASDQPYRLQMFKLRLVYASDIHLQDYEAAAEQLKKVVTDASDKSISDLRSDPPQLETVLNKFEPGAWPSWIQMFNKELIRTLSFSEHEAFDHPVACLLVVSSKDEQPINKFVDLFNTNKLPSLLNEGAMDPKILKNYVLLHDNHDGTPEKAASILAEMRNTFGSNDCKLLCINSAQGTEDELKENPWAPFKTHASLNQDSTCFLNVDDLNGIREFMQDFSSKNVIPHMEQKIRILNQQVSATRKGFRNQIKNLWWRKGKDDAPENLNGPTYTFSSIESQIRVLADYAFMLRDYELALSNYRLLSTDYKLDKSWKRYAGVQEMMGLSYFMLDQSRKESEYCMENAFNTYLKIGSSGQRNGTRCGLWWAEMLKAREQYKDAATIYFRISREEPYLHAAVMLEQSSYCYLFSFPRMLRKYGLHLILAGNRYYTANQRYHAIRTYRSAHFVYEGNAWSYISNHVHFNIGRWYALLGISDVATKYMLEVLPCSHMSVSTQELFLTEFCKTVQNMGKLFEVCKLQLPVINMSSLKVIYEDHRTYASSADVNVGESIWYSLEEEMVPTASAVRSNWLETEPKFNPLKKHNDSKVSVAGEAIKLELECKNPLQISISLSGVSLICEFSANSEATKLDECVSDAGLHRDAELKESPSCSNSVNDVSLVTLSELNVILEGRETKKVQLDVTPKVEGFLKIIGVRWTLSGSVVGYHYFDFDMKKKQRKGRSLGHPSSRNLNFVVIKGLPKLEGGIQHLPKKVYAGDLRLLTLELRNHSEYRVKNLKMAISHPRFLIPGDLEDLNLSFPSCLEKQPSSESKDVIQKTLEKSKSLLFTFPNGVSIEGGTTFKWPLWFHTGISGNVSFYISIYYEMECCSSDMTYRTLRMHYDLEVMPSIDVSLLITPCPLKLQEFLVRMDIVNRTLSESFSLHQLSCVGDKWQISLLPGCAALGPMQVVPATQAISCFFKLKNCRNSSSSEIKIVVQGNVVQLSKGSEEILIDTAKSPLADFHHHERYHQAKSSEGSSSIDFILISKMLENESYLGTGVSPQLLSNHACHCSITSKSPVWWLMEGPRTIAHDFSSSLCQPSLRLTIRNCTFTDVSIRVTTFDPTGNKGLSRDAVQLADPSGIHGGWHEVSLVNDIKAITDIHGSRSRKPLPQSISPFVWCASSATQLVIGPGCSAEVPVSVCVFSPGTYDLSSYEVHWKLQPSDNDGNKWSSGTNRGHPFILTVLQCPL